MNKRLFGVCLFSMASLLAEQGTQVIVQPVEKNSHLYVAPVWDYLNSHWGNGTKQTGSLWGANVGYTYAARDTIFFNGEFTYMAGMLKGSAGNDPTQEYITDVKLGYDLSSPFGEDFTMTPFIGMGSYVFNQSLSGNDSFHSHFWYVPIGVSFCYKISNSWSIGFMGLGAPTFSGRWKITHNGGRGNAPTSALWKGELPVMYTGSLPFEFAVVPFVKGWAYHANGELIEQRNTYYGVRALFGYRF